MQQNNDHNPNNKVHANAKTKPNAKIKVAITSEQKMTALALSFPSMHNALGIDPFNPLALDDWARNPAPGSGARITAQFLLEVWDPGTKWRCGKFNLMRALRYWDGQHLAAFMQWIVEPWWP